MNSVLFFKKVYLQPNHRNAFFAMKLINFLISYYKSLVIFLMILYASIVPSPEIEKVKWLNIPNIDKPVHFIMYFTFAFILIYDLLKSKPYFSNVKIYFISFLTAVFYGGVLEILQSIATKSRSGDIFDFLFDTSGALLAILLWWLLKKFK